MTRPALPSTLPAHLPMGFGTRIFGAEEGQRLVCAVDVALDLLHTLHVPKVLPPGAVLVVA